MKQLLEKAKILTLCLALVLTVTACSDTADTGDVSKETPPTVSSSIGDTTNESSSIPDVTTPTEKEPIRTDNSPSEDNDTTPPTTETIPPTEDETTTKQEEQQPTKTFDLSEVPAYSGSLFVAINDNVPFFSDDEMTDISFESYSNLDSLGRCGVAVASVGLDIMPTEDRESISSVYPTGWEQEKYSNVDGGWLYNRCHILGFQLTGENANEKNLITGTRQMNVDAMLPFENMVADYVKETGNHVYLRVTPIFEGNNLLATGVLMEAKSVEDNGDGVLYNVFCYNAQEDVTIDYATGNSSSLYAEKEEVDQTPPPVTELQTSNADEGNVADVDTNGNGTVTIAEAKAAGYKMPITSDHWLYKYMRDADGDGMVGENN